MAIGAKVDSSSEPETPKDFFTDETTRKLVTPKGEEYRIKDYNERIKFLSSSITFADNLRRLHGIKPLDRKVWRDFPYTGRGMLSIPAIINKTLRVGRKTMMETRRVRLNPDRPSVAMLFDLTTSMVGRRVIRAAILLGMSFVEFLGRGFALDFTLATIGMPSNLTGIVKMPYEAAKGFLTNVTFNHNGTYFTPAMNFLEQKHFFDGQNTKWVIIITDGEPIAFTDGGHLTLPAGTRSGWLTGTKDWEATRTECDQMIVYMKSVWMKNPQIEFFWLQLGDMGNILNFVSNLGYLPPIETAIPPFTQDQYAWAEKIYKQTNRTHRSTYGKWGEFLFTLWRARAVCYMNLKEIIDGSAFHQMIDYFLYKFKRRYKM